ncbi:MAG TPA: hypothetical protein VGO66_04150 [Solirubrobacterales bacterium]|jgi:hypothetical protein|nr:hypothetical protein [Solirubrobacterales bacterium]
MNPLKKGPEIKLPELRMPQFLVDLYHDLDDRHLLPVVAALLVGIVAIPLLLGGSSGSEEAAVPGTASASSVPKTSSLVVTKATPDLRDYKRRLKHLSAQDPFAPVPGGESADSEGGGGGEGSEPSGEASVSVEEGGSATVEGGESGGTSPAPETSEPEIVYFTFALDVRVVPVSVDGKPSKAEPYVRRDLPPLTMLPSRDVPALTYMGPSKDGKKALMLVSSDVTAIFGDSACVVGSQTCQLLALEPRLPETVVFGPNAKTYRVELQKIQVETTDHLNRAPLGQPKHSGKGQPK